MLEFLSAIEASGPVEALKRSFYVYPLVNALHILSIGALLTGVFLMDLRLLGFLSGQPFTPFVRLMRRLALAAFPGAAVTGALMFGVRATDYVANPAFQAKMALILLAAANVLAFRQLPEPRDGPAGRALAILSIALWLAVLVCGRFIGFL
ncbi:hypothetical protein [Nitratireductor pacificus]|uniref:DUF2214 domain-containing protein n=1 Tax=Nitratireductor pacificus pht-3B TaxID=391937 RepID=K2LMP9_9HYPH|nr:hypothetical protein [Nitratireductor pacificus]EKF19064.1 hypothetical protein NA2_09788 [Nitratireductor pacificus pht-3B]